VHCFLGCPASTRRALLCAQLHWHHPGVLLCTRSGALDLRACLLACRLATQCAVEQTTNPTLNVSAALAMLHSDWTALRATRVALFHRSISGHANPSLLALPADPAAVPSPIPVIAASTGPSAPTSFPLRGALKRCLLPGLVNASAAKDTAQPPGVAPSHVDSADDWRSPLLAPRPPACAIPAPSSSAPLHEGPVAMGSGFHTPEALVPVLVLGDPPSASRGPRSVRWNQQASFKVYNGTTPPVRVNEAEEEREAIVDISPLVRRTWVQIGGRKRRRIVSGKRKCRASGRRASCGSAEGEGVENTEADGAHLMFGEADGGIDENGGCCPGTRDVGRFDMDWEDDDMLAPESAGTRKCASVATFAIPWPLVQSDQRWGSGGGTLAERALQQQEHLQSLYVDHELTGSL
jgi:hypothetical protein